MLVYCLLFILMDYIIEWVRDSKLLLPWYTFPILMYQGKKKQNKTSI